MERKFKEARRLKNIKLNEAAQQIGVSQPTLSAWEGERKAPSLDNLTKMATYYNVSTDYLLGIRPCCDVDTNLPITEENLPLFHGMPVWVKAQGWALLNMIDKTLIFIGGEKASISKEHILFALPTASVQGVSEPPLQTEEIAQLSCVWVEPLSFDGDLRTEFRGRYIVQGDYVENTRGNRFFLDSYKAKWLAFKIKE